MKASIRITDAEWEVMRIVWGQAPVPASTVADALEKRKHWSLATVRTLLRRLVNKGALDQQQEGKRFLYRPRISMDDCVRKESESFLDRVMGRTPPATVLALVEKANLSKDDIQELRRLLKEKEKEP
ncbi:MAG TPA: CopY/TcrY family copper transport repressor [Candidatus Acidoferrum sp.]|jgi:BlaI family penicillinase repressor|nr:CopY/TcrY family copper transport repressor [Candidatus Acidoferrum sp.]